MQRGTRLRYSFAALAFVSVTIFTPLGLDSRALGTNVPHGTKALFSVVMKLRFGNCGPDPSIDAVDKSSIFLTGTFSCGKATPADLMRVDRENFRVVARVWLPTVTSVAYGDGSLWWATGAPLGNAGTTLTPGDGRLLLRVNPTNLKVTGRFKLPGPTELVTIAHGNLWVATRTSLYRLNPVSGAIMATVHLGFNPAAMAASYDGSWLYVLGGNTSGSHLVVTVFSSVSGRLLGTRKGPNFSSGPFAVVRGGVWIPVQSTVTQSTTMQLFKGRALTPASSLGRFTFDTSAYVGSDILWIIDAGGIGPTECAGPLDGVVRARGGPVGVEYGAMDFDDGSTYLLRTAGLNQSLLQIEPSARCSR
jgi:hypothetical protein